MMGKMFMFILITQLPTQLITPEHCRSLMVIFTPTKLKRHWIRQLNLTSLNGRAGIAQIN